MNKNMLDIYSDYLIAQNGYATATGLSQLLDGEVSHDKITRFLNGEAASSKELWQYVKPHVRKIESAEGILILDDSIEEKPYTDENELVSWHYSHAKNRCVKGINILSCLIRYGEIALPISYEPIVKDIIFCDIATKKLKRQSSVSKNEMFRTMIAQAVSNEVPFEYVLADNWFGAKKNMEFIHYDMKKKFIIGIKANRLVALMEGEKNASLEKSPTKVERSQRNHIFAAIIAYCKLELLKAKTFLNHFALKYKLLIQANRMAYAELKNLYNITGRA